MKEHNSHNGNEDYFDYLAEMGSTSISADDLKELNDRIDKRVDTGLIKTNNSTFTTILVVAFTAVLLFVLFKKTNVLQIGASANQEGNTGKDLLSLVMENDTVHTTETPALTIAEAPKPTEKKEHFIIESRDEHFAENLSVDVLPSRKIGLDTLTNTGKTPAEIVELLPNASVIYIYDLKVTEFQKLYFKKMKPYAIQETGLSAAFENSEAYQNWKNENALLNPYTLDMLLKDALKAFSKTKYKQAFVLFDELLNYNSEDVNALFYSGLSQFYSGKYEDAAARFNKLLQSENNVFNQEAEWYKALSLEKNGDKKEAIELLLKINKQKGFYALRAGEKLEELSKAGK